MPEYQGPFTIVYIHQYTDRVDICSKEYETLEAVNAFIFGRQMSVNEYVVVEGIKLLTTD